MGIVRRFLKKRVHFGWKRFRIDFDVGIRSLCFTKNEYFIRSSRFVIFDRDDRRMRVENGKDLYNPKDINEVQIDDYITIKATLYQDLACRYLDKFREKKRFLTIRQVTKMGGGDEDIVYMDVGTICLNLDKIAQGPMIVEGDIPFFSSDNSMAKGYIRAILRYRFVNYKPPKPRKVKKMPPPVRSRFERNREVYDAIANAISSKYGGFSIDEFDLGVLKKSSISSSTGEGYGGSSSSSIDAAGIAVIGAVAAAEARKGGNGNTSDTETIANLDQLLSKFHLSDKEFGYSPSEGEERGAEGAGGGEGASGVVEKNEKQKKKRLSAVQRITQQFSFNSNKSGNSGGSGGGDVGAKSMEEEERKRNGRKKDKKTKKHTETKEETLNNYFNATIANSSSTDRNERDNERGGERDEAEEERSVRKMGSKYLEPARKSREKRSKRSSKDSRERKERHSSEREDRTPPGSGVERKPHRQESGESNHTYDSKTSSSTTRSKRTGEKDMKKRKHSRRRSSASANSDSDTAGTDAQPSPSDNPADTVHVSINNSSSSKCGNSSMRSSSNKTHQQQRLSSGHDRALEPLVEELDRSVSSDSRIEARPPLTPTSSSASRGAKTATAGTAAATATINPRTAADEAAALLRHREQTQHTVGSARTSLHSNGSAGDPQQPSESESGRGERGERGARGSGSYGVPVSSKLSAKVRENLINNTKDAPQNRWFDFDPVMNDHHNQQQEQQHYQQQFQPHQQLPRGEKAGEGAGGRVERTRHGRRSSAPDTHPPVHPAYTAQNELQHHLQQQGNIQTTARPHSMNHHQPPLFPSYSTTYSSAASFASLSASTAAAGDDRSSQQGGNYPTPQSPQWMDVNPQYGTVHASSTHYGRTGGGPQEYSVPPYSLYGQVANNQQQQCHRPDHFNHHQQEQQQQQRQSEREQVRSTQIGGEMQAQRPGLGQQSQHQSTPLTRADSEEDMLDFGISTEDFVGVY